MKVDPDMLKNHLALHFNSTQIYSLKVITLSFSHLSIGKLFWEKHLFMMTEIRSCILSQCIWYNKSIQVDKASAHFFKFFEKSINYVLQLFSDSGSIKKWAEFKR